MAATANTILLVLFVSLTFATTSIAHLSPLSNEAQLLQKCTEALGEVGGAPLVTFCARDLLGHRAAFLATCDRRKTVAVVVKEAHMRVKAVEDFGAKINSDKSLSGKELRDLKSCWTLSNNIASSVANIYTNFFADVNVNSIDVVLKGASKQRKVASGVCNFSAAERQSGVWLELKVKVQEASKADMVALAFVNHLYAIAH